MAPMALRIHALTAPPGVPAALRIDRTRARDEIVVSGRLPWHGEPVIARVTVEDPPLYAAAVFTALLRARGVRVGGAPAVLGTPGTAALLREVRSPPLAAILREMNKKSKNLVAEMLLKALGMRDGGAAAGTGIGGAGEAALRAFLERSGLRGPALVLADGSGLSRQNLVSPRNLVRLLAAMDRHSARNAFFDSLPVAGVDGTLRRRMAGTAAAGAVRAKTGTLAHVTALSGVATTCDGERLVFSILTNNYPGALAEPGGPRAMEDAVAVVLAEFSR
jgi:PBP4 family serine-type D-alanyl-D-alanine carboxypeptidase